MRSCFLAGLLLAATALAAAPELDLAREHYQHAEYTQTLAVLRKVSPKDWETLFLVAKADYGLEKYGDAIDALEDAVKLAPDNPDLYLWLGRAWGRRAETANIFQQVNRPFWAGHARDAFEHALQLDPDHREALDDLFEYYVEAPGFLGGGLDKAEELLPRMAKIDPAWAEKARAQVSEKRNDFTAAERHLRRAIELAPAKPGPELNLAKFLARQGRIEESDQAFAQAARLGPDNPEVLFGRAQTYVEQDRNLEEARDLLEKYVAANLTPDDPPRSDARELLKKIGRR